jgi:hypothetical protein
LKLSLLFSPSAAAAAAVVTSPKGDELTCYINLGVGSFSPHINSQQRGVRMKLKVTHLQILRFSYFFYQFEKTVLLGLMLSNFLRP